MAGIVSGWILPACGDFLKWPYGDFGVQPIPAVARVNHPEMLQLQILQGNGHRSGCSGSIRP